MSKFEGTPGEWYVRYGGTGDQDGFGIASKGIAGVEMEYSIVAEHWPCTVTLPSRKLLAANAHLIAASPNLLAACAAFVSHYPQGISPDLDAAVNAARDAIRKAVPTC